VRRTQEIIAYLQPRAWWVENPWTGMLKKREVAASSAMCGVLLYVLSII
jgi:hypothetical protein